ncbi:MAG: RluA family pseudouridine synthase [Candidatus Acetothermia bacterium]|jgi:23S rRNA pseudouridine1911/1915/1917 synthase|nr:RluA family pseudouridine synthase [Candidatus Acetothermia bacterium]
MGTKSGSRVDRVSVAEADSGERVDRLLARKLGISRSYVRALLASGAVTIGGGAPDPDRRVQAGEEVVVAWDGPGIPATPYPIPILYEDEQVVVVDKPRGLAVHPVGPGRGVTVVSALLAQGPLAPGAPGRPGVVHRLDVATTGALVLARTESARASLVSQFQARTVVKEYLAVVEGELDVDEGAIEGRVERDDARPWRMKLGGMGKDARTEFTVLRRNQGRSLLLVRPHTGRTHQIRLHLAAIGHPVVGDPVYGKRGEALLLHAWRLGFRHPATGAWMEFEAPPPPEFLPWLGGPSSTPQR